MKTFRVRAVDIRTKRPMNYEAFEAADEADVEARLNRAGIVAQSITEVSAQPAIRSFQPSRVEAPVEYVLRPKPLIVDFSARGYAKLGATIVLSIFLGWLLIWAYESMTLRATLRNTFGSPPASRR